MSRRSKRLGATEQEDDRISTSSVESHVLYRDSPARTLRKKVTTIKRIPPTPRQTTEYYSETSTYVSGDRLGRSTALQETDYRGSYWGDGDLAHKRIGPDTYSSSSYSSSSKNGLSEAQITYDRSTSSSGYSSEEDYAGQSNEDGGATRFSWWRRWAQKVARLPRLLISFPGHVFGLLYWWFGTTWYRITTSASLLDVFILTRHYNVLKKVLLILLMLLLLALLGAGLWHLYPFGLPALLSGPIAAFSRTDKPVSDDILRKEPQVPPVLAQDDLMSRMESLERRFHGLENGLSQLHQKETQGGGNIGVPITPGLSREDVIQVYTDMSRNREAALKEDLLQEGAMRSKSDLKILQAEQQEKLQEILKKMHHMSEDVEGQILQLKTEMKRSPQEDLRENLMQEVGRLEEQLVGLQHELESVRKTQMEVSQQVAAVPEHIRGVKEEVHSLFPMWLQTQSEQTTGAAGSLSELFLRRDELQKHLVELERKILAGVSAERKHWETRAHTTIDQELHAGGLPGVSREEVHIIVNRALQRYSEDRIGMVDYALETSGASVINTRCSETYETKTALLSLFGIPLWYQSQSPRVILQPDTNPGNCWAFRGSQGYAVVRLSSRIRVTAVTLDHIPRSLSPKDTISSAPQNFSVYGLEEESQKEGTLLGTFTYNQHGDPIQTFPIEVSDTTSYQLVELRILSNWGHPEYTCIYRFRVHGETEV
ncbi:SUN domain-containing protein 2 [Discoglossus pictus]